MSALLRPPTQIAQPYLVLPFMPQICSSFKKKRGYRKVTLCFYSLVIGFLSNLEMDMFWESTWKTSGGVIEKLAQLVFTY